MRVRLALPRDRAKVIETVAAAFRHDPGWGWLLGDEYERVVGSFAGTLFDLRVVCGNVWVTEDLESVAMWDAPGSSGQARAEEMWGRYRQAAGARVSERLDVYNNALAAASPAEQYWYLGVLATHPVRQGEGLATALFAPVLREADESQLACCLETSTEPNRRFYERRGFTESTEVLLADGPPTRWLRRPPRVPESALGSREAGR
jgi:GNAT superfamily N-acetyltransferase